MNPLYGLCSLRTMREMRKKGLPFLIHRFALALKETRTK
jgi:hypothetical protein